MSDANAGRGPNGRTPVTDERAATGEDDRPTAEMAPVGRPGSKPATPAPGRPTDNRPGQQPGSNGQRNGAGPAKGAAPANGAGSTNGAGSANGGPKSASSGTQAGGPQPTASGWTPPPLPGRQTPAPPVGGKAGGPTAAAPKPPVGQKPAAPLASTQQPDVAQAPGAAPKAGPAQPSGPAQPVGTDPAADAGPRSSTDGSAAKTVPVPSSQGAAASPSPATDGGPAPAKPSFWAKLTEGLGFEKKTEEVPATAVTAAAQAPGTAAPAVSPAAASSKTPTSTQAAPPAPSPQLATSTTAGKPAPGPIGAPSTVTAPTNPGPQYRPVQTGPQARTPDGAPRGPVAVPVPGAPGQSLTGASGGATALVPAVGGATGEVLTAGAKPRPVSRRTRKARLRLSRLDPWSVMKTSFLFSIAAGIMLVVAVYGIWLVLSTSGLFGSLNEIVGTLTSNPGDTTPFRIEDYVGTQKVVGGAALLACLDVLIFTALATLGSFLYNLAATMLGGLEITLAED